MTNALEGGFDFAPNTPDFLKNMREDFPDEARAIAERYINWAESIDEEQGVAGLGDAILGRTEYVGNSEKEQFEASVAAEMADFLTRNPDGKIVCVVYVKKKGSGPFYFNNVVSRLDEGQRERTRLMSWVDVREQSIPDAEKNEYFIIDDSSNSGQQLQTMVFSTYIGPLTDAVENLKQKEQFESNQKVKLKIRLLRLSDDSRSYIQRRYVDNSDLSPFCEIDMDGNQLANKKATTMNDVLQDIGITEDALAHPDLIMESHAGRRPTVLHILSSKAPDNLPLSMVWGGYSNMTQASPLIEKSEYDKFGSAYKHYSNILMGARET